MRPLLLLPVLAAAPLAAQTPEPARITGTTLDIVASGEARRVPDIANINAGVVTMAPDAATAVRDNAARITRVIAALKRAGVAERDIQTANLSLSPQYRYAENQPPVVTGYQATNALTIRFRDIARAGVILDALVATGVNQINGPDLTLDKPEAALDEARVDAIAKAKARAELYARAAGLRVVRILSISEAPDHSRPMPIVATAVRMQSMDAAESKVMPGEQTVGVTVSVRFELQ